MRSKKSATLALITSMCIFGTIGLVRRFLDIPSGMLALARAWIGAAFLLILLAAKKQKPDMKALRRRLYPLLLSGAGLGFNWILLFEAYNHTTVATATLCYYMAPVLVILASAALFREKLNVRKILCCIAAVFGVTLVSGVLDSTVVGSVGVLLGLAAAVLYTTVVLMNKHITDVPALDRTVVQLLAAGLVILPYSLLTENWLSITPDTPQILLLLIAGIVHTGIAYALYFGAISHVSAQTAAMYSYLDPVLAVLLSAVFLSEPLTIPGLLGAVLILGAAVVNDIPQKKDT